MLRKPDVGQAKRRGYVFLQLAFIRGVELSEKTPAQGRLSPIQTFAIPQVHDALRDALEECHLTPNRVLCLLAGSVERYPKLEASTIEHPLEAHYTPKALDTVTQVVLGEPAVR